MFNSLLKRVLSGCGLSPWCSEHREAIVSQTLSLHSPFGSAASSSCQRWCLIKLPGDPTLLGTSVTILWNVKRRSCMGKALVSHLHRKMIKERDMQSLAANYRLFLSLWKIDSSKWQFERWYCLLGKSHLTQQPLKYRAKHGGVIMTIFQ